jgi:hypothetical protein
MENLRRRLQKLMAVATMITVLAPTGLAGTEEGCYEKGGEYDGGEGGEGYCCSGHYEFCFWVKLPDITCHGNLACTGRWARGEGKINCKNGHAHIQAEGCVDNDSCHSVSIHHLDEDEFCGIPEWIPCRVECHYKVHRDGEAKLHGSN